MNEYFGIFLFIVFVLFPLVLVIAYGYIDDAESNNKGKNKKSLYELGYLEGHDAGYKLGLRKVTDRLEELEKDNTDLAQENYCLKQAYREWYFKNTGKMLNMKDI